jgi:5-(carboxyamino)imidazole ribonucleotide mutase
VGIVYGSPSDEAIALECKKILEERLGVPCEATCLSAHRQPEATADYAKSARSRGLHVIIAMAGMAAHLPGVVASLTTLPVLGVPLAGPHIEGMDALLSMAQMPAGVPVGTLAIGKAGSRNAALLAGRILALDDPRIAAKLDEIAKFMEAGGRV